MKKKMFYGIFFFVINLTTQMVKNIFELNKKKSWVVHEINHLEVLLKIEAFFFLIFNDFAFNF